ncbi:skin secretory protein xP2-like [Canis lupus dingo]|uniref:skin secretory protein xP2-like n=1 Tax=Canis lupus dingo TaxID=286419 RepID=UPI0020C29AD6|nr:skin secretory protein xP2-like [Canis lupus dingo]
MPRSAAASLPPSLRGGGRSWAATAAATGAWSRSRSAGARSSSRAPAAEARRGRAAERAPRGASRAPVTARAGPGEAPGRLKGRRPRPTPRGRAAPSARFLWARGGRPSPSLSGAGSTRARLPRLTCPFPAPVPATPTGLCRSLRVARSPRPKYRETSRGGEGYCGKGLTSLPQFTDQQV